MGESRFGSHYVTRAGAGRRFAMVLGGLSLLALMAAPALAQDAEAAQLTLRIQNLEAQVRGLTGEVQGLQFQLTQLQRSVGGGANAAVAPPPGRAYGNGADAGQDAEAPGGDYGNRPGYGGRPGAGGQADDAGSAAAGGDDELGPSGDPLVGRGQPGASLNSEEVPLGPSARPRSYDYGRQSADYGRQSSSDAGGDFERGPAPAGGSPVAPPPGMREMSPVRSAPPQAPVAAAAGNPAAQAAYKLGYQSIIRGDYTTAAGQFRKFLKQYPDDPQAPDATNWLGEALLQQQSFVDAADVLVNGYKSYPDSPRAPDMLLKLGIALSGAQQGAASCKTFGLLTQKYPNTTAAFKTRLRQEMARAKCKA